jgi:hypothetical protein
MKTEKYGPITTPMIHWSITTNSTSIEHVREMAPVYVVEQCSSGESSSMRTLFFACLTISVLLTLCACNKRRGSAEVRDACSLLAKEDVQSAQAASVNETKSSRSSDGGLLVSQCFYTAAEFSKSVNLALVQNDLNQQNYRSAKDFWEEKFGPYGSKSRDSSTSLGMTEENEKGPAPKKISGLGDDAYWVPNRFGGVLYVLKGDAFISIGIGGTDDEETKLEKSKALAQKALQRL